MQHLRIKTVLNYISNIDLTSIKSINGIKNSDLILKSVKNVDVFLQSLNLIKLWAKNKNIYSNIMGYLGGVSWALLTAKIC